MPRCFLVVIERYEDSRILEDFKKRFWSTSGEPFVDGDVHEACYLRVIPLTDGDVGHYDKEPGESNPLDIFNSPCDAEGLNIVTV